MERFTDPVILAALILTFVVGFATRGIGNTRGHDEGSPFPTSGVEMKSRKPTAGPRPSRLSGTAQISDDDWAAIDQQIHAGRKITAIKLLRAAAGIGLREAKDAVDSRARELGAG